MITYADDTGSRSQLPFRRVLTAIVYVGTAFSLRVWKSRTKTVFVQRNIGEKVFATIVAGDVRKPKTVKFAYTGRDISVGKI